MSFTTNLKNEIIGIDGSEIENISELAALLNVQAEGKKKIKIITESVSVSKRIFNLVKKVFQINCQITVRKNYSFSKKNIYILEFEIEKEKWQNNLGLNLEKKQQIPAEFIVADEEMKKAYLRGVFLVSGSLSDPKKINYHLEFVFINEEYAKFILQLLNDFDLNAKILQREKKYMVYIKEAEKISDFLKVIGAGGGLFYFEDIRIYRDHKNMTNRLNNCEQANVEKTIATANKQIAIIEKVKAADLYLLLNDKVKLVADYRLKYPETSLDELATIISLETNQKITKSGVFHRLKKIEKIAEKIKR